MALVGCRYIQAENPGAVGFGFEWFDTSTGIVSSRDATNTKWVRRGDFSKPNMGFASKSDVDAILSTKAPLYNPNFTGTPTKDGQALITKKDIADMQQTFLDEMDNRIKGAISQGEKDLVVDGEIVARSGHARARETYQSAMGVGIDNPIMPILLPTYQNNSTATEGDCAWCVGQDNSLFFNSEYSNTNYTGSSYVENPVMTLNPKYKLDGSINIDKNWQVGNFSQYISYISIAVKGSGLRNANSGS